MTEWYGGWCVVELLYVCRVYGLARPLPSGMWVWVVAPTQLFRATWVRSWVMTMGIWWDCCDLG